MMLAGATTLFVPHAGKIPPRPRPSLPTASAPAAAAQPGDTGLPTGVVTVETSFRLPPEVAYEMLIHEASERYDVNPALIRAVIATESAFDASAVSPAGALGLMQLMPALAEELGVIDPFDPRENIMGGVRYLKRLLDYHNGDLDLALASYNAGPANVERYGGVPPFRETRNYINTVKQYLQSQKDSSDAD